MEDIVGAIAPTAPMLMTTLHHRVNATTNTTTTYTHLVSDMRNCL